MKLYQEYLLENIKNSKYQTMKDRLKKLKDRYLELKKQRDLYRIKKDIRNDKRLGTKTLDNRISNIKKSINKTIKGM